MHALLIALTGTVVALGVSNVRPAAPAAAPAVATLGPDAAGAPETPTIDLRGRTLGAFLDAYASKMDRPVLVHWRSMEDIGLTADRPLELEVDGVQIATAFELVAERTADLGQRLAVFERPDLIEIGLLSDFDRRTIERRIYDAGMLIGHLLGPANQAASAPGDVVVEEAMRHIAETLESQVSADDWLSHGGDLARRSIVGDSIIISAPARIHEQVAALLDELAGRAAADAVERERIAQGVARARQRVLSELQSAYESAKSERLHNIRRLAELRGQESLARLDLAPGSEEDPRLAHEQLNEILEEIQVAEFEAEDAKARSEMLRQAVIQHEIGALVGVPPEQSGPARGEAAAAAGYIYVQGAVERAGVYEYHPGITVGRMIVAAGGLAKPGAKTVRVTRADQVLAEWTFREAMSEPARDTVLLPGDEIAIMD